MDWYLEVLKKLDVPVHWNFEWLPERPAVADEVARVFNLNGLPLVVLQPGARWENKRWPAEYFRELVARLHAQRPDLRFAVLGGNSDRAHGEQIVSGAVDVCANLAGKTTLPQMVELIRASSVLVTNDTGPMHVAAALRKPVVALFGPTDPARTGAYGQMDHTLQRHDLPCIPCMRDFCTYRDPVACLRGIAPAQVAAAVLERLG